MAGADPEQVACALTERQLRIAFMLPHGFTTHEMAHWLRVSEKTLRDEMEQISNKLELGSTTSRAQIEVRLGLQQHPLISATVPEAAWVKFWSGPGLAAP